MAPASRRAGRAGAFSRPCGPRDHQRGMSVLSTSVSLVRHVAGGVRARGVDRRASVAEPASCNRHRRVVGAVDRDRQHRRVGQAARAVLTV